MKNGISGKTLCNMWKETLGIGEVSVLRLINPRLQIVKEYELTRKALTEVEGMLRDMRLAIQRGEGCTNL